MFEAVRLLTEQVRAMAEAGRSGGSGDKATKWDGLNNFKNKLRYFNNMMEALTKMTWKC